MIYFDPAVFLLHERKGRKNDIHRFDIIPHGIFIHADIGYTHSPGSDELAERLPERFFPFNYEWESGPIWSGVSS